MAEVKLASLSAISSPSFLAGGTSTDPLLPSEPNDTSAGAGTDTTATTTTTGAAATAAAATTTTTTAAASSAYEIGEGRTLFLFGPRHPVRRAVHRVLQHRWFKPANNVLTLAVIVTFAVFPTHWSAFPAMLPVYLSGPIPIPPVSESASGSGSVDYTDDKARFNYYNDIKYKILIALFSIITLRMIATIIQRGLIGNPHAFLRRNFWNILDCIYVSFFWTAVGLWSHGNDQLPFIIAVAALYSTHMFAFFSGVKKLIALLVRSAWLLLNVFFFVAFFMSFFAIIGQRAFQGSMSRQCVYDLTADYTGTYLNNTVIPATPMYSCGSYTSPFTNETVGANIMPYYGYQSTTTNPLTGTLNYHTIVKGYTCPQEQICEPALSYYNGFRSFDDFGSALLIVIDTVATSGWTFTMYILKQSEYPYLVPFYFIILVVFVAFILTRLFVAVLAEAMSEAKLFSSPEKNAKVEQMLYESEEGWVLEKQNVGNLDPTQLKAQKIFGSKIYRWTLAAVVAADMAAQASRTYSDSPAKTMALDNIELAFTLFFLLEVIVKLALLRKAFFKKQPDMFLAVVTCIIQIPQIKAWNGYGYLTAFQIMRFYRVFLAIRFLRELIVRVTKSAEAIFYVLLLMFMWEFCMALFAMHFLAGQYINGEALNVDGYNGFSINYWILNYSNEIEVYPPRHNFNTFLQSFLNVFRLTTADNWEDMMYDSMQSQWNSTNPSYPGYTAFAVVVAAMFFAGGWLFSKLVLYNMVVASILDNFDMADREKLRQQYKKYMAKSQKYRYVEHTDNIRKTLARLMTFHRKNLVKVPDLPKSYTAPIEKTELDSFVRGKFQSSTTLDDYGDSPFHAMWVMSRVWVRRTWRRLRGQADLNLLSAQSSVANNAEDTADEIETPMVATAANGKEREIIPRKSLFSVESVQTFFESELGALEHFIKVQSKGNAGDEDGAADYAQDNLAKEPEAPPYDLAFGFMSRQNPVRRFCRFIVGADQRDRRMDQHMEGLASVRAPGMFRVQKPLWDYFMIAVIITSTGFLASETPRLLQVPDSPDNYYRSFYRNADYAFFAAFALDIVLRLISDGVYLTPKAYFLHPWNIFDVVLTLLLGVDVFHYRDSTDASGVARAFRALRGLRPLRLINQFDSLKAIFNTFVTGWNSLGQAVLFAALIIFPFAIWAVNIWRGTFFSCNDGSVAGINDCTGDFIFAATGPATNYEFIIPRVWSNTFYHDFDNVGDAMLALYEDISTEGWTDQFWTAQDFVAYGVQPQQQVNIFAAPIFFLPFMLVGWTIVGELFVATVVDNFRRQMNINSLTSNQRRWNDLVRQLNEIHASTAPPPPKESRFRRRIYDIIINKRGNFAKFIVVIMFLHLLLFMTVFYVEMQLAPATFKGQAVINLIFLIIYGVELALKVIAVGPRAYTRSFWNWYDVFVVFPALISSIVQVHEVFTQASLNYNVDQVTKVLVLLVLLRLVQKMDKLETLFKTLYASFWDILNISLYCVLVLISFSVMSMQLFGLTRILNTTNTNANFHDFFNSIEMLFRMATGESWNYVMHDLAIDVSDYCVVTNDLYTTDCGSPSWSYTVFCIWYALAAMISLDMFLAVILDKFSYWSQADSQLSRISRDDIRDFKWAWSKVDENMHGEIHVDDVPKFLCKLRGRFFTRICDEASFKPLLSDPMFRIRAMSYYQPRVFNSSALKNKIVVAKDVWLLSTKKNKMAKSRWSKLRGLLLLRNVFLTDIQLMRKQAEDPTYTREKMQQDISKKANERLREQLNIAYGAYHERSVLHKRRDEYNAVYLEMLCKADKERHTITFQTALRVLAYRLMDGLDHLTFAEREARTIIRDRVNQFVTMDRAYGFLYNLHMATQLREIGFRTEKRDDESKTTSTALDGEGATDNAAILHRDRSLLRASPSTTTLGGPKAPLGSRTSPSELPANIDQTRRDAVDAVRAPSLAWAMISQIE